MSAEDIANRFIECASTVRPGEVLVVEQVEPMCIEAHRAIVAAITGAAKSMGVRVLFIPFGMRAARVERKTDAES